MDARGNAARFAAVVTSPVESTTAAAPAPRLFVLLPFALTVAVVIFKLLIVRHVFAELHQFLLCGRTFLPDFPLQGLTLFELLEDQCILFGAVALPGLQGFTLIHCLHFGIAPGDPVPQTGEPARQGAFCPVRYPGLHVLLV